MTGLVTRYIWVWPPWDTGENSEHPNQIDYRKFNVKIGTTFKTVAGNKKLELCACIISDHVKVKTECYMNNVSVETDTDSDEEEGIPMDEKDCMIKGFGVIEVVSERQAILLMKSGRWIRPEDSIILDIDEDYYGCEAAVTPLYEVGVRESQVRDISMWVQLLACAAGTYDEKMIDNWFHSLIQLVKDYKRFCKNAELPESACTHEETTESMWKLVPDLLQVLRSRIMGKFCKKNPEFILKMLLSHLSKMSSEQLSALAEIGVCLSMSPKTLEFKERDNMRVCDGYNRPNETMVFFHTPNTNEIDERTDSLQMILDSNKFTPRIVTVCRSTRDGYTPKKYFRKIESDVLDTLIDTFPEISENNIFYDEDLLGGPFGWHGRH